MNAHDLEHDREAQTAAAGVSRTTLIEADEAIEHPRSLTLGNARSVIVDPHQRGAVDRADPDRDPVPGVTPRVVDEVLHRPPQQPRVTPKPHGLDAAGIDDEPLAGQACDLRPGEIVQVDGIGCPHRPLIQPRQQQTLESLLHPRALLAHDVGDLRRRRRAGMRLGQLGVLPHRRQRRAQFVGCITGEPLLCRVRLLDAREHPVHRRREQVDLIAGSAYRHPMIERVGVDRVHLAPDAIHRRQRLRRDRPDDEPDDRDGERHGEREQRAGLGDSRIHLGQGCTEQQGALVERLPHHEIGLAVDDGAHRAALDRVGERQGIVGVDDHRRLVGGRGAPGDEGIVVALGDPRRRHESALQSVGDAGELGLQTRGYTRRQVLRQQRHDPPRPETEHDGHHRRRDQGDAGADAP